MRLIANPRNPFESQHRELLEPPPQVSLEVYDDATREILSRNESPDLPFRWSVNPYRGCFHACAYCYARPSHEYWGFGAGTDFDSKIVVKRRAPALLREALMKPSWQGELIVFSGIPTVISRWRPATNSHDPASRSVPSFVIRWGLSPRPH